MPGLHPQIHAIGRAVAAEPAKETGVGAIAAKELKKRAWKARGRSGGGDMDERRSQSGGDEPRRSAWAAKEAPIRVRSGGKPGWGEGVWKVSRHRRGAAFPAGKAPTKGGEWRP